jgi:hypothetical protein
MNVNSKRDGFVPQNLIQLWKPQRWRAVSSQHCSSPQERSSSSRVFP